MQALILAGGKGSRMSRISAHLPKPLLYLPAGTLLDHQLALLARLPVSHTFVVLHHRAQQMEQALWGHEGVTPLQQRPPFTLLGALASAERYMTEPFLVLHADNYFSQGLDYFLQKAQTAVSSDTKPDATFLVDLQAGGLDRGRRLASTGCYVLSPQVFPVVKRFQDGDQLLCLTGGLLEYGAVVKEVPLRGWRANINDSQDLLRASGHILEEWSRSSHPLGAAEGYNRVEGCLKAEPPLWISTESEVVDSDLGPYVVVGPRASVRNCELREVIVFPGARVIGQRLERGVALPAESGFLLLAPEDQVRTHQEG